MAKKWVCCLVKDGTQACRIVERLQRAGFTNDDLSVVLPDEKRILEHEKATKAPEGAVTGGSAGAVLGGILGLLTGFGALVIPGLGPFVAAGPLMAALSGVAAGGVAGGLMGTLIGLGIPEFEAKLYQQGLKEGKILLAVYSENSDEIGRAKDIFEGAGGEAISTSCENFVNDRKRRTQPAQKAA